MTKEQYIKEQEANGKISIDKCLPFTSYSFDDIYFPEHYKLKEFDAMCKKRKQIEGEDYVVG